MISVEHGADRPSVAEDSGEPAQVIELPTGTKIWIAAGVTDLRRGFDGLSAQVQNVLHEQPFSGHVFVFRGAQRRHRKTSVVGRRWSVPVCQAAGARPIHLAEGRERHGAPQPRTVVDASGRD